MIKILQIIPIDNFPIVEDNQKVQAVGLALVLRHTGDEQPGNGVEFVVVNQKLKTVSVTRDCFKGYKFEHIKTRLNERMDIPFGGIPMMSLVPPDNMRKYSTGPGVGDEKPEQSTPTRKDAGRQNDVKSSVPAQKQKDQNGGVSETQKEAQAEQTSN